MEIDKLKKWMDAAQAFQSEAFWNNVFDTSKKNNSNGNVNPFKVMDFFPKCDLYESDHYLKAEIEVPGVLKDQLHLSIQEQMITISGEFRSFEQHRKYFLKERPSRSFKKEIALPYPIKIDQVKSEMNNGVLYIAMAINQEEMESIPINLSQKDD
ncbi:Hsp20/alpha crystallin family protein [Neobacillus mesonae]|uniref:Hsp20/alpha crystallin family protein n=1 Tax=Neobacillus mesonae TaxID=1193713 RepID=UPI00203AA551|nr:Hsp20/alpha crystallin family protein [Neobacillus mesonae]MCM3568837.1 Hsp20/alpha crystallin family protein [Neobacillus mesonae]